MNELIAMVKEKTGISEEQAKSAVDTVMGFLKQRLPAPVVGQIETALKGTNADVGVGNIRETVSGMLGGDRK